MAPSQTTSKTRITDFSIARLGVNIDHIATLRQLRQTPYPSLVEAARLAEAGGADQITVHLREDQRHIQPEDVTALRRSLTVPLNLEMAVTPAMIKFALKVRPDWVCLVPERRQEVTTEGGLDVLKMRRRIDVAIAKLHKAKIKVSPFIAPTIRVVQACAELGADAVEFHTGDFCRAAQGGFGKSSPSRRKRELERLAAAAHQAIKLGVHAHAGHGFDYTNVREVAELERDPSTRTPLIEEYNIGHAIVCRAALVGLERAVREMASAIRAP